MFRGVSARSAALAQMYVSSTSSRVMSKISKHLITWSKLREKKRKKTFKKLIYKTNVKSFYKQTYFLPFSVQVWLRFLHPYGSSKTNKHDTTQTLVQQRSSKQEERQIKCCYKHGSSSFSSLSTR